MSDVTKSEKPACPASRTKPRPKPADDDADGFAAGIVEEPPPAKPAEQPKEGKPKEEKPKDDKTGQVPKCEPGALADTLNDLLGTDFEGVCEDDTLGNAEGHGDSGDGDGHGGME